MRSIIVIIYVLLLSGLITAQSADYNIVPRPEKVSFLPDNNNFILDSGTNITLQPSSVASRNNASYLRAYILESTGITLVKQATKHTNSIVLKRDTTIRHPEGYTLEVTEKQITISAKTDAGIFYGIQTLRKSLPVGKFVQVSMPQVAIQDAPRFSYRGMHLDVSRHFFDTAFIKRYIDILALHNINRFHWHLTDDQGWRIEIKLFPKLTSVGSKRSMTVVGRNTAEYDSVPHSGFYTQKEIKEIVKYAADRYITIIPEIDMPGHMLSALTPYPELGCTGGPYQVATRWGIFDDVLCAGNEKTYRFVEKVLDEVVKLFPSQYIHIGGDECNKVRWKDCPRCQLKINELGLITDSLHTAEAKLQSYFITRIENYLHSKKRKIIGWDEILEGGLAPDATVMSWQGVEGGIAAAKLKHNVIMASNSHLYFNFGQDSEWNIQDVYSFNPLPAAIPENEQKFVIGVQGNLWSEYIKTPERAEFMILPRMAALCEVQWCTPENQNYSDFAKRFSSLRKIYELEKYNYARFIPVKD
jgi:hexosaminidase